MKPIIERWRERAGQSDWESYQEMDDEGLHVRLIASIRGKDGSRTRLIRGILASRIGLDREKREENK
jgi:hypothetical protein